MRFAWPLLLLLCLCSACDRQPGTTRSNQSPAGADPVPTSPWLDPNAVANRYLRFSAPAGSDVRQAGYWKPSLGVQNQEDLRLLVQLRDYDSRSEGVPDRQKIVALNLVSGDSADLTAGDALPFHLLIGPGHDRSCAAVFHQEKDAQAGRGKVGLICFGYSEKPLSVAPATSLMPLAVSKDGGVLARKVAQVEVDKGLAAATMDWGAKVLRLDVASQTLTDTGRELSLPSPFNEAQAGLSARYDPALPSAAVVQYLTEGPSGSQRWEFPYFINPSSFYWLPDMAWVDARHLAAVTYLPGGSGGGQQRDPLFRITALDAETGQAAIVEDHVTADVSLVASGNVLWYALRNQRAAAGTWELWVSSADGMNKSLVWSAADTAFLDVLDCLQHRRLLLHRQYFPAGDQKLVSELLELSLDRLPKTPFKDKLVAPQFEVEEDSGRSLPGAPDSGQSDDLFQGEEEPPAFIPDNPGDGPPPIAP